MAKQKSVQSPSELSSGGAEFSYDIRILQALRQIIRYTELHSRYLASQFKVTAPQLVCLLSLQRTEPLTSSKLAEQMYVSASTVVGILDRLEEKQLVARERSTTDRRVVEVSLTDKARELLKNCPSPLQDRLYTAMEALPEAERLTIAVALERIVQMMGVQDTDAEPILEAGPLEQSAEAKALISKAEEIE